jgi:hypothetical protein
VVDEVEVIANVEELPAATGLALNVPEMPVGKALVLRTTLPVKPLTTSVETV